MEGTRPYLYRLSQIRRTMFPDTEEEEQQNHPGMLPDDVENDRCFTDQFLKPTTGDFKSLYSCSKEREVSFSGPKSLYSKVAGEIPSTVKII